MKAAASSWIPWSASLLGWAGGARLLSVPHLEAADSVKLKLYSGKVQPAQHSGLPALLPSFWTTPESQSARIVSGGQSLFSEATATGHPQSGHPLSFVLKTLVAWVVEGLHALHLPRKYCTWVRTGAAAG